MPRDSKLFDRLQRIRHAIEDAKIQNDFAAVGAGPNRYCLSWGS